MLLDIESAAKMSGVDPFVLRRYARLNRLPATRLASGYYVLETNQFVEFLADYRAGKIDGRRKENKKKA